MAEYIERDAILESIAKKHGTRNDVEEKTALDIWDDIKKIPTADVVPVVRCKDCKHWNKTDTDIIVNIDYGKCTNSNSPYHNEEETTGGDYCSYGERRCEERETENKPSMD